MRAAFVIVSYQQKWGSAGAEGQQGENADEKQSKKLKGAGNSRRETGCREIKDEGC